jgi:hypothetical protein
MFTLLVGGNYLSARLVSGHDAPRCSFGGITLFGCCLVDVQGNRKRTATPVLDGLGCLVQSGRGDVAAWTALTASRKMDVLVLRLLRHVLHLHLQRK